MAKTSLSSLDFQIEESKLSALFRINGVLTEHQVSEMRKTLEAWQSSIQYFKLNLENVTAVDHSSIEPLYSTCKSITRSQKTMIIDGICPIVFTSAVQEMGLSYHRWLCFGN